MRAERAIWERAPYLSHGRGVAWAVDALVVVGTAAGLAAALGLTQEDEGSVWDWLATTPGVAAMLLLGFLYLGWLTPSTGRACGQSLGKRLGRPRHDAPRPRPASTRAISPVEYVRTHCPALIATLVADPPPHGRDHARRAGRRADVPL